MKYIKKFENLENWESVSFKIGDYVLIKSEYFTDRKPRPGKIVDIQYNRLASNELIKMFVVDTVDFKDFTVFDDMFGRKLDSEEIEQFKIDCTAKKFNL